MAVEIQNETLRNDTLEAAKRHKASWIALGQYLFSIHKDKLYKNWGFLTFETYCKKELGIKDTTASKLLKSYAYLEKEEPKVIKPEYCDEEPAAVLPHYESVNMLRLAKNNKNIAPEDFSELRNAVIKNGKEPKEFRAQVQRLLSEREVKDPAEVRQTRRNAAIKRLVTVLSNTKKELEQEGLLPAYLLNQISELASKLEDQIEA